MKGSFKIWQVKEVLAIHRASGLTLGEPMESNKKKET
jgi:hypothetical protein